MPAKMLTKEAVKRLKPLPNRVREVPDAGARGLRLAIYSMQKKSWVMRYRRPSGAQARLTLGTVDDTDDKIKAALTKGEPPALGQPLTLREARALAGEVNRQRALGIDVAARHVEEKKRRAARTDQPTTFGAVARRFCEDHALKMRSGRENTARVLGLSYATDGGEATVITGSLAERWRDRDIAEIDAGDLYDVVTESVRIGIPGLETRKQGAHDSRGRALAAALSKLFSWTLTHRLRTDNPARGMYKPKKADPRDRVLTDNEIKKLWRAFDQAGYPFGIIAKLLLLTGQRRAEVSGLRWSELSEDLAVWTLPAQRTKNKSRHTVYLPEAATKIIAGVPRIVDRDLLFSTTGSTAVSGWSKAKRAIDAAVTPLPEWRVHDLRRTTASGMQKLGVRTEVIERALNHKSGSYAGVAGVYQRDPMTEEVRAALELWASHVTAAAEGKRANVVNIASARS